MGRRSDGVTSVRVMTNPSEDITPDMKNWTWVLEAACDECGFDTRRVRAHDIADVVRANAAAWPGVLRRPDATQRPHPGVWSALEYACHVRDVYRVFAERLSLMLDASDPEFADWDQDATAVEDGYATQDPAMVSGELLSAAEDIATAFDAIADDDWQRTGRRGDGSVFTVETLGRYMVHDPEHHLYDVAGVTAWKP